MLAPRVGWWTICERLFVVLQTVGLLGYTAMSAAILFLMVVAAVGTQPVNAQPTSDRDSQLQSTDSGSCVTASSLTQMSQMLQRILAELSGIRSEFKTALGTLSAKLACPSGFTYIPEVRGCYKALLVNLNWTAAGQRCRSLHEDAHLIIINSSTEQNAIGNMLDNINNSTLSMAGCTHHGLYGYLFWTAGQRVDPTQNATFVYRVLSADAGDTVTDMVYTNWIPGEPNNYYGRVIEPCMEMGRDMNYRWNDDSCSSSMCSVCEVDIVDL